jgi:hypothetical protein
MTWYALADNGLTFVRVGTGGAVQTNPNPDDPIYTWTNRTSGTVNTLYGLTWNGAYFVAVGASGTALYSADGITWNPDEGGVPAEDLYDVASLSNVVIAVGANGTIIVSQWGGFWQSIPSGTSEHLRGVTVGDSAYIAVGDNSTIVTGTLTSYDLNVYVGESLIMIDSDPDTAGSTSSVAALTDSMWINAQQANVDHVFGAYGPGGEGASAQGQILTTTDFAGAGNDAAGSAVTVYMRTLQDDFTAAETPALDGSGTVYTQKYQDHLQESTQLSLAGTKSNVNAGNVLIETINVFKALGVSDFAIIADAFNITDSDPYALEYVTGGGGGTTVVIDAEEAGVWVAYGAFFSETVNFDEPELTATAAFSNTEAESFTLDDVPAPTITFAVAATEAVSFDDTPTINQILNLLLTEGAVFTTGFTFAGETYRGVVMNVRNKAVTEYDSYDFNSMGYWGGSAYGTKADGIYRLEGSNDAGVDIDAHVLTAITNFGNSVSSRVERAYLGIRNDGSLTLKVIARQDDDTKVAHLYDMTEVGSTLRRERVKLGKGVRAAYFQFELSNTAGGDFELDEMVLVPIALARRIT